jgi:hypothetical protein
MEESSKDIIQYPAVDKDWVYYKELDPIPDNLLGLNVCTLDFKVKPRFSVGELPEDRAFHELLRNPSLIKDDFIIKKEEIIPFLSSLEEASGGKGTFRFLFANTPTIRDSKWDLKFLNLYLNPNGEGYIVCNRKSRAIRYRDIIPNIDKSILGWYNSQKDK